MCVVNRPKPAAWGLHWSVSTSTNCWSLKTIKHTQRACWVWVCCSEWVPMWVEMGSENEQYFLRLTFPQPRHGERERCLCPRVQQQQCGNMALTQRNSTRETGTTWILDASREKQREASDLSRRRRRRREVSQKPSPLSWAEQRADVTVSGKSTATFLIDTKLFPLDLIQPHIYKWSIYLQTTHHRTDVTVDAVFFF